MKGRMSVPMSKMFRWIALLNMLISISRSALLPPRLQTIRSIAVRDFVVQPSIFAMALLAGQQAVLARSTLAPPPGVDSSGMLSPCPDDSLVQCVSSQDDRPACFLAPWEFDGEWTNARTKLVAYVLKAVPGSRLVSGEDATGSANNPSRYLRFEVLNKDVVDDLEFYFTPNDDIIQYRSMRRQGGDFLGREQRDRVERIRKALQFENIAVLRNRQSLFFLESPLDQFGPPSSMFDGRFDEQELQQNQKNVKSAPIALSLSSMIHGVHSDWQQPALFETSMSSSSSSSSLPSFFLQYKTTKQEQTA